MFSYQVFFLHYYAPKATNHPKYPLEWDQRACYKCEINSIIFHALILIFNRIFERKFYTDLLNDFTQFIFFKGVLIWKNQLKNNMWHEKYRKLVIQGQFFDRLWAMFFG